MVTSFTIMSRSRTAICLLRIKLPQLPLIFYFVCLSLYCWTFHIFSPDLTDLPKSQWILVALWLRILCIKSTGKRCMVSCVRSITFSVPFLNLLVEHVLDICISTLSMPIKLNLCVLCGPEKSSCFANSK